MVSEAQVPAITQMIMANVNVAQSFGLDAQLDPLTITILTVILTTVISTVVSYLVNKCLHHVDPVKLSNPGPLLKLQLRGLIWNARREAVRNTDCQGIDVSKYDLSKLAYDAIVNSAPAVLRQYQLI
jgi:hypothetical protein